MESKVLVGIGGEAGAGVMESGNLLAQYALSIGLYSFMASEYPSLIRGGHNYSAVHISPEQINSLKDGIDLLIALNEETIKLHQSELHRGSGIIYDLDKIKVDQPQGDFNFYGIPLTSIAKESGGPDIIRNTVALGAAIGLLQGDFAVLETILKETFAKKGDEIIKMNVESALKGYRYAQGQHKPFQYQLVGQPINDQLTLINGNDAMCIGAIKAGLKFAAIYPMTPITSILDYLAAKQNDYNLVVKEPEDEISAIIMSIGASYSGARSLTATSGGGFCLMTEGLGMAGIAEIPLVIIEGMRSGPSSAMATKTEQSDLEFVLHSSHGEFPRVVLAPGDPEECLKETFNAFNIADKYQLPVIVVTDKYLASSISVMSKPNMDQWKINRGKIATDSSPDYQRYALNDDGVSPRAIPGVPGLIQHATSYEHDTKGHDNDEPKMRVDMMQKRMKKLDTLAIELPEPALYGPENAQITIFGWGSNKGIILDSLKILEEKGIIANYLHLLYVMPFPAYKVAQILDKAKNTLMVENNYTGQMARYITTTTGRHIKNKLLKYDGTTFIPEDIVAKVEEILGNNEVSNPQENSQTGVKND